jgi:alpha-beta hydrolase superfamily lysophospholipase
MEDEESMSGPVLDRPEVLQVLFYPRREEEPAFVPPSARAVAFEVEPGLTVGGRLYPAGARAPAILFFHGNGEIAADYDDLAPLYTRLGITLLVADYRGYGSSGGTPTASNLLTDAVTVLSQARNVLEGCGLTPARLYVMGRSLGSAAAIEVASKTGKRLAGLIVESGFADTFGLLARLGLRVVGADEERDGMNNAAKMSQIQTPALIIHGQSDVLIPVGDGQELYRRCAATDKRLVLIPGAGHNDLMLVGVAAYFGAIRAFVWP